MTIKLTDDITLKNIFAYRDTYTNSPTQITARRFRFMNIRYPELVGGSRRCSTFADNIFGTKIQLHGDSLNTICTGRPVFIRYVSPHAHDDIDIASYYDVATFTYQSLIGKRSRRVRAGHL